MPALWALCRGRTSGKVLCRSPNPSPGAAAAVHSGLGRALAPAAFNLSALPTYIRCAPGGVGGLVEQLRRQLMHPGE